MVGVARKLRVVAARVPALWRRSLTELSAWRRELRSRGVIKLLAVALWPALVTGIAMKVARVVQLPDHITRTDRLLCLAPDLLFAFGLTCVAIALLDLRRAWRHVGLVIVQVLALLTFAIDLLAFGYYKATGLVLDYETVALSLARVEETAPVVTSEITRGMALAMCTIPLWLLIAPWTLGLRWSRRSQHSSAESPQPVARRWCFDVLSIVAALVCFAGSYAIAIPSVPVSFTHDAVLHLVVAMATPASAVDQKHAPPPRHTGPKKLIKTPKTKPLNVVVIVLESTRHDATTAYKPKLLTTPFLAELAKTGTRVDRAYAIVPHTSKALVAMLCGFEPRPTPEIVEATAEGMPGRCLAKLLGGVGYDTAYFQAPKGMFEQRPQLVKNMGYRAFHASETMPKAGFASVNYFGYEDAIMLEPSNKWLTTKAREPFFATYLTSASHHPYGVPPTHVPQAFSRTRSNNKYLNAVHYVDGVVKQIVDQYKAAGLYERTIFVVVGDHGEGFNEHRLSTHDDVIYEEGLRVPLIVVVPGRTDLPRVVKGPLNQLDIVPTILSLLALESEGGQYEGQSIYTNRGTTPLYAACHRNAQCMTTIRGDMKLLYFFDDKPTLLFNVGKDPRERHNIADKHPDLVRQWTDDVRRWMLAVQEAHKPFSYATIASFVTNKPPKVAHPIGANVSGMFEVVGCDAKRLHRSKLEVTCRYRVLGEVDDTLRIRVRGTSTGVGAGTQRVFDHRAVRGLYPFRDWRVDEYITDKFDVYAPLSWEREDVSLCLLVERKKVALNVSPAPAAGDNCVPFAVVPARAGLPARVPPPAPIPAPAPAPAKTK